MAKFTSVNTIPTNGSYAMVLFKTTLKAAGWTVPSSSDSTTYNSTGDQITTGASGAGGFGNTGAWFVIREPGGRREYCFQRGTLNTTSRIKYSALARFTGGSPGVARVPSATDEQVLLGGGTDASPSYSGLLTTDGTWRCHIVANSTAIGGVYPFCMFGTATPGATQVNGLLIQEPLAPGSYDVLDLDPALICVGAASTPGYSAWFGYGGGAAGGAAVFGLVTTGVGPFNGTFPADYMTGKDVNGRPYYTRTTGGHWKGYGTTIAVKGPARTYPATCNTATDGAAYLGSYVFPFADNVAPGV